MQKFNLRACFDENQTKEVEPLIRAFETKFQEACILRGHPAQELYTALSETALQDKHDLTSRVEKLFHHFESDSTNRVELYDRITSIPRKKWRFYFIQPGGKDFVWLGDNSMDQAYVNFDIWLDINYQKDNQWLKDNIFQGLTRLNKKYNFDSLCLVNKSSGPKGPVRLAREIAKEFRTKRVYRYQRSNHTLYSTTTNRKAKVKRKACLVYDTILPETQLPSIHKELEEQGLDLTCGLVLYDYGADQKLPFKVERIITDPSLNHKVLEMSGGYQDHNNYNEHRTVIEFKRGHKTVGPELLVRSRSFMGIPRNPAEFTVLESGLRLLDECGVRYSVIR